MLSLIINLVYRFSKLQGTVLCSLFPVPYFIEVYLIQPRTTIYSLVIDCDRIDNNRITLTYKQQHYLANVLRLRDGDRFVAMDGLGKSWLAEIAGETAQIIESIDHNNELPIEITLITALPKGDGYEQIIRCCTELGVQTFQPVISERTIIRPSERKISRWRKIATEAAEQSERQIVPVILEPVNFTDAIDLYHEKNVSKYICVARGEHPTLWNCLTQQSTTEIIIATGCEGGWTELEIQQAISVNYREVSLGKSILRAITAPIVAVSQVAAIIEHS
jgi:16S rRNA (uracil1498-N3)-methyltransferase